MPTNFNPLDLIKSGGNPEQIVMNYLETQMGSTPMGKNLLNLARGGRADEIELIARNLCKQKGVDFDKEFNSFKRAIGM